MEVLSGKMRQLRLKGSRYIMNSQRLEQLLLEALA